MPLTDTQGVAWAHKDTVKAGARLRTDGGFTCIGEHEIREVKSYTGDIPGYERQPKQGSFDRLYIDCEDGEHFLDGQVGEHGELVGLYDAVVVFLATGVELLAGWLTDAAEVTLTLFT